MTISCPSCGAPVAFRGTLSVVAVCGNCRSQIARKDADVQLLGTVASVPYDLSPIQIGTRGRVAESWPEKAPNGAFEVVGRLKRGWSDGLWNEWVITFNGQRWAWLAEAQGLWSILHPMEHKSQPVDPQSLKPGKKVVFGWATAAGNTTYTASDVKETTVLALDGELPSPVREGTESLCIDFVAVGQKCATLEREADGTIRSYIGRFYPAQDLNLSNLRTLDGWRV